MTSSGKAYAWGTTDRVVTSVITTVGNIVLARMLTTADFGLVAMVGIFIAIGYNLSNCGMIDGIIRKERPTASDYSTMMLFNMAMGVVFCGTFIGLAAPVASYLGHEELKGIMYAIGICFVVSTMSFSQEARLRKELRMKEIAIVHVSSTACAVTLGIVLAACGMGYWALVSCRVFVNAFTTLFYLLVTRWMPRIAFSMKSFRELFGFGMHLMLAFLCRQVGTNINTFFLGQVSASQSGVYSQAQKTEEVPYAIVETSFVNTFYAVCSNELDPERRRVLGLDMLRSMMFVGVAIAALLMVVCRPMVVGVYGWQWEGAAPIIRVLVVYGVIMLIKMSAQQVLKVHGMSKLIRNYTVAETVLQVCILLAVWRRGVLWIAWSQVVPIAIFTVLYLRRYAMAEGVKAMPIVRHLVEGAVLPIVTGVVCGGVYLALNALMVGCNALLTGWVTFLVSSAVYALVLVALCERQKPPYYMPVRAMALKAFGRKKKV